MKKVVLITGASHGIGRELALVFAKNGYDVVVSGRNSKRLRILRKQLIGLGRRCWSVAGDIVKDGTIEKIYTIAKKHGVRLFINNAGIRGEGLLEDLTFGEIDRVIQTNLIAPLKLTKLVYSLLLIRKGGSVININSVSGLEAQPARPVYCASKWGLRGFAEALKKEAARRNIRVINVYPSRVKTRREFTYGMEPQELAEKIYHFFVKTKKTELIVDNRPKKYRKYA